MVIKIFRIAVSCCFFTNSGQIGQIWSKIWNIWNILANFASGEEFIYVIDTYVDSASGLFISIYKGLTFNF